MIKELINIVFPGIAVPISWMWCLSSSMCDYSITTPEKVCIALGTFHHETQGFTRFEESFNYTPERLLEVFPSAFREVPKSNRLKFASDLIASGPEMIGDFVYKKIGGYKFRGRGPIMLTGKENYDGFFGIIIAVDVLDRVSSPNIGSKTACWFMESIFNKIDINSIDFNNPKDHVLLEVFKRISGSSVNTAARYRSIKKVYDIMKQFGAMK